MTPADPDIFAMPDPAEPDPAALEAGGRLARRATCGWTASRSRRRRESCSSAQIAAAASHGYELKTGVECEFFLITPDGTAISDAADTQAKPCYDQQALMRRYDVITEICDAMLALGWGPYQNDHEDANGQFEMNWEYDDALTTADRHAFFKYMVKAIAEKHGLRATFMPKPFADLTGNGCHVHVSLWDKSGTQPVRRSARASSASRPLAYNFLGGVMHSADGALRRSPIRRSIPTSASTRRAPCRAPPGRRTRSPMRATTAPT